jgi:exopolysaccharide biosynthesis polyprenyl glycosylphosphotransferase
MLTSESTDGARQADRFSAQPLSASKATIHDEDRPATLVFSGRSKGSTRHDWAVAAGLLALDIISWTAIYAIATFLRGDAFYSSPLPYILIELLQLSILVGSLFVIGGYNERVEMRGLSYSTEHVLAVVGAAVLSALLVYSAATFDQTMKPSRGVLLISFVAFLPVSLLYRRAIRSAVSAATANRAFLVVGSGDLAVEFYEAYTNSVNRERLEFVDTEEQRVGEHIAGPGSPIIEGDLGTKLERLGSGYSGVILAERIDRLRPELLERLVRTQFHDTRVYTLESFHEAHWRYVPVHSLDPFWPLQMGFQLARNSPYHYVKRLFDIALSSVLLVISSPVIAITAVLIWVENGGPAIFRQTRVGRDNALFTIFKFRTMFARTDEAATDGDIYTRPNDPRITRVGRWLRKARLDELPQLWNVLRGEMSLIGPRAEWIKCAERYEKVIPFYHFRHLVKPGITGWAQVNYGYGESDEDAIEKLKYDLYYIRNYSLKLDLMIVFKTAYTVLFGRGQ